MASGWNALEDAGSHIKRKGAIARLKKQERGSDEAK